MNYKATELEKILQMFKTFKGRDNRHKLDSNKIKWGNFFSSHIKNDSICVEKDI